MHKMAEDKMKDDRCTRWTIRWRITKWKTNTRTMVQNDSKSLKRISTGLGYLYVILFCLRTHDHSNLICHWPTSLLIQANHWIM
jgi:hypothetical protein